MIRFDTFKRKIAYGKLSPRALTNNMTTGFVLKADIRHYFPSVNHEILIKLIERKVSDQKVINLLKLIIQTYANEEKGMPLGAVTSQLFANIYLNPLDHFLKEKLKVNYYIRYLDDFVILGKSKEYLEKIKEEIAKFITDELELQLHPEKTKIFPLHSGTDFLGFRIFCHHRLLKKSNITQFNRRLKMMDQEYIDGFLTAEDFQAKVDGWLAHAQWANTYKRRNKVEEKLSKILKARN